MTNGVVEQAPPINSASPAWIGVIWLSVMGGHHVIAVPVPILEDVVRERTAFYDASFISTDPAFVHAHITLLAPWIEQPTPADLDVVASIFAAHEPFTITLAEVDEFPDGLVYLRPDPDVVLRTLTHELAAAFPDHPPYGGQFGTVSPHLTLDRRSATVTTDAVRSRIAHLVPTSLTVDRVDLQWWQNDRCHLTYTWPVGRRR